MSDSTETLDVPPDGEVIESGEPTELQAVPPKHIAEPHESEARRDLRERLLVPLLLPVCSLLAVVLVAVNISRVFLSGSKNTSVVIATCVTIAILVGAATLSAAARLRTQTLALILGSVVIVIVMAGLVTLGTADQSAEKAPTGYVQPTGKPVASITVTALASTSFTQHAYAVKAGILQITFDGVTGHNLNFTDAQFAGWELLSSAKPDVGKVLLTPGKYEIFCNLPGHKAAGMDAIITVTK
jgi:plastocyanin